MNQLQIFNNSEFGEVRTTEENGQVLFCGSDVAKALGYSNDRDAVSRHCKGVVKRDTLTNGGKQELSFIPEGDIYRLAARSKLPGAEKFESWIFDEVIPSIRKTGGYGNPYSNLSPQLQLLISIETEQKRQGEAIDSVTKRMDSIGELVCLNPNAWRKGAHDLIVKIAVKLGGFDFIREVNNEVFSLVNTRAGVNLESRVTNKRARMADKGVCKSKRDKVTKVDAIADDKKLIEIYLAVVKEMAIKYGVDSPVSLVS